MKWPSFTKIFHHKPYDAINPKKPDLSAEGKVVLITGAGSGIGQATAIAFAQAKAKVIILCGRRPLALEETRSKIIDDAGLQSHVEIYSLDVSSEESVAEVFKIMNDAHGAIDICINGAGYLSDGAKIHESSLDNFWQAFEVTVKGSFLLTRAFLKQNSGADRVLIMMNSYIAHLSAADFPTFPASYMISKLAQAKMMECVAAENVDESLRIYAVHPGTVDTAMTNKGLEMTPGVSKDSLAWDEPELAAHFFVWLASGRARKMPSGRYLWCQWDVEELEARADEIKEDKYALTQTLSGWPFVKSGNLMT